MPWDLFLTILFQVVIAVVVISFLVAICIVLTRSALTSNDDQKPRPKPARPVPPKDRHLR